jgi:hypothetical protein
MCSIKSMVGAASTSVLVFGFTAAAIALPSGAKPVKSEGGYETRLVQEPADGRQVNHPAWSFGCAEPDVAVRGIPCDEPIYVYGAPCEVGVGPGQSRPCRNSEGAGRSEAEPARR